MRTLTGAELRPGMVLGGAVRTASGRLLLRPNVPLTDRHVELLRRHGLAAVVNEPRPAPGGAATDGDLIDATARGRAAAHLGRAHRALTAPIAFLRDGPPGEIPEKLASYAFTDQITADLCLEVERAVDGAAEALLSCDVHVAANAKRAEDDDLLVHALDTTAVAVALGRRLHLDLWRLRELAAGCLLHDIGMLLLPDGLLDRGRLTGEQRALVRIHPSLGYQLLRRLRPGSVIANHVAYQHHERQDGRGYPRGLVGTNRISRPTARQGGSSAGRIVLEAEIVAVADVFVALTARRPQRSALPVRDTVGVLARLGGRHLNREVVAAMIDLIGQYPLGVWTLLSGGRYSGQRGVVVRVHEDAPGRPTVRLLRGPWGEPISPVDVDLRSEEAHLIPLPGPPKPALARAA